MSALEIIVPTLNESAIIADSCRQISRALANFPATWNITVIDNGSTDGTASMAAALSSEIPVLRTINLKEPGKGAALIHGILQSSADFLCYIDADLSIQPSHIHNFYGEIADSNLDIIAGSRLLNPKIVNRSRYRTCTSRLYNLMASVMLHLPIRDAQCGFKILRAATIKPLVAKINENGWFFDTELIARATAAGLNIAERPVAWEEFRYPNRESRLRMLNDGLAALKMFLRLRHKLRNYAKDD